MLGEAVVFIAAGTAGLEGIPVPPLAAAAAAASLIRRLENLLQRKKGLYFSIECAKIAGRRGRGRVIYTGDKPGAERDKFTAHLSLDAIKTTLRRNIFGHIGRTLRQHRLFVCSFVRLFVSLIG